ncbi:MAG: HAD-IIA family hydrolase [Candidatus Lokiarchaeota archaeon]|nr:HAD-IIA family hydrolase [Candidatus Lokiarchaeota archaeon]
MSDMISSKSDLEIIKEKEVFFFDLDGTIYLGNKLFNKVIDLIKSLKKRINTRFFFLSNNSSKSTEDYLQKLNGYNLNITIDNIILSQHPVIYYLKEKGYKKVFLMGTTSLKKEFENNGFQLTEEYPEILVLAFDQELTYERLVKASKFLEKDIPYIATHLDDRCPTEDGYIPDAGGFASLLYKTTERMPKVLGKPNKEMLLFKLQELGISSDKAIMFGDRLYTDIKMGKNAGVTACCVLSGETKLDMIKDSENKPDLIIEGVWKILDIL